MLWEAENPMLKIAGMLLLSLLIVGCSADHEEAEEDNLDGPTEIKPIDTNPAPAFGDLGTAGHDDGIVPASAVEKGDSTYLADPNSTNLPKGPETSTEIVVTGARSAITAATEEGWSVTIEPAPTKPGHGSNAWKVTAAPPDGRVLKQGELAFYAEGKHHGFEVGMPDLQLTPGEPGVATLSFGIEKPGSYEIKVILAPTEGKRSEIRYTFGIESTSATDPPGTVTN